ncbi:MAG: HAD family hydrolase [Bacteroidetes bacterium]|nr:MAG: HAD family hydrolase [Bacteroidota bacterium]
MTKQLLIFDFDGTIADTLEVAEVIINDLGRDFGLPEVSREQIMHLKHKSIKELLHLSGLSWAQLPAFIRKARKAFHAHLQEVSPIEGMPELIHHLDARGFRMGILSSNTQSGVKTFLTRHQLECFEFIHTPDSIFGKGRRLRKILKSTALPPPSVVMIGDEVRDVEAAHDAGIEAIAVTWGFNTPELLAAGQPAYIVHHPAELQALLEGDLRT